MCLVFTPLPMPGFYNLKNLSGPHLGNFKGSGILSRFERTLKTKAGCNKKEVKSK
jgi:hypothetical protein